MKTNIIRKMLLPYMAGSMILSGLSNSNMLFSVKGSIKSNNQNRKELSDKLASFQKTTFKKQSSYIKPTAENRKEVDLIDDMLMEFRELWEKDQDQCNSSINLFITRLIDLINSGNEETENRKEDNTPMTIIEKLMDLGLTKNEINTLKLVDIQNKRNNAHCLLKRLRIYPANYNNLTINQLDEKIDFSKANKMKEIRFLELLSPSPSLDNSINKMLIKEKELNIQSNISSNCNNETLFIFAYFHNYKPALWNYNTISNMIEQLKNQSKYDWIVYQDLFNLNQSIDPLKQYIVHQEYLLNNIKEVVFISSLHDNEKNYYYKKYNLPEFIDNNLQNTFPQTQNISIISSCYSGNIEDKNNSIFATSQPNKPTSYAGTILDDIISQILSEKNDSIKKLNNNGSMIETIKNIMENLKQLELILTNTNILTNINKPNQDIKILKEFRNMLPDNKLIENSINTYELAQKINILNGSNENEKQQVRDEIIKNQNYK